jgi:hypothetical protein
MPDQEPRHVIARRQAGLPRFIGEATDALRDLARALSIDPISADDPERSLPAVTAALRTALTEALEQQDRLWLLTRLMHFIAAIVMHRHGGAWRVEEEPAGRFHGRYVIGGFPDRSAAAVIDPAAAAAAAMNGEPLEVLLAEIDADLRGLPQRS